MSEVAVVLDAGFGSTAGEPKEPAVVVLRRIFHE